jgi:hypothetical protein
MSAQPFAAACAPASASPTLAPPRRLVGLSAIALAVVFNIPFSVLGATFDYPHVLRRPPGDVLDLFAAGGPALIVTWYGFMLCAMALAPFSAAFALTPKRIATRPVLAIGAASAGVAAALAQAIGLSRWVFVVPGLSRTHLDPAASADAKLYAERTFEMLGQALGVGVGEHIGQLLTALFIALAAGLQWGERQPISAGIGFLAAATMMIGTGEGLVLAMGQAGDAFAMATIAGFLGMTAWLIASGVGLLRRAG